MWRLDVTKVYLGAMPICNTIFIELTYNSAVSSLSFAIMGREFGLSNTSCLVVWVLW